MRFLPAKVRVVSAVLVISSSLLGLLGCSGSQTAMPDTEGVRPDRVATSVDGASTTTVIDAVGSPNEPVVVESEAGGGGGPPTSASQESQPDSSPAAERGTSSNVAQPVVITIEPRGLLRPGSTFEVHYSGGSGELYRGATAALIAPSGETLAVLVQQLGSEPATWSRPGGDLVIPGIGRSGVGSDRFVVPTLAPGGYLFRSRVDGVDIDQPLYIS